MQDLLINAKKKYKSGAIVKNLIDEKQVTIRGFWHESKEDDTIYYVSVSGDAIIVHQNGKWAEVIKEAELPKLIKGGDYYGENEYGSAIFTVVEDGDFIKTSSNISNFKTFDKMFSNENIIEKSSLVILRSASSSEKEILELSTSKGKYTEISNSIQFIHKDSLKEGECYRVLYSSSVYDIMFHPTQCSYISIGSQGSFSYKSSNFLSLENALFIELKGPEKDRLIQSCDARHYIDLEKDEDMYEVHDLIRGEYYVTMGYNGGYIFQYGSTQFVRMIDNCRFDKSDISYFIKLCRSASDYEINLYKK